jgi:hypothetical protein
MAACSAGRGVVVDGAVVGLASSPRSLATALLRSSAVSVVPPSLSRPGSKKDSKGCGLHEILAQIRGENSSVIRSGWAGAAALRATASPGPAKHVVAADYIPPGVAVATVNAFLTDAGRVSQPHALAPWTGSASLWSLLPISL